MKDRRTHLAYKAKHAVDLESEAIVAAQVTPADRGETATGEETLILAQVHLVRSGSAAEIKEVVQDKGYHDNEALARIVAWGGGTYVPERKQNRIGSEAVPGNPASLGSHAPPPVSLRRSCFPSPRSLCRQNHHFLNGLLNLNFHGLRYIFQCRVEVI